MIHKDSISFPPKWGGMRHRCWPPLWLPTWGQNTFLLAAFLLKRADSDHFSVTSPWVSHQENRDWSLAYLPCNYWLPPTLWNLRKVWCQRGLLIWVSTRRVSYWLSHQEDAVVGHLWFSSKCLATALGGFTEGREKKRSWERRAGADSTDSPHGCEPGPPRVCACWRPPSAASGTQLRTMFYAVSLTCTHASMRPTRTVRAGLSDEPSD